VRGDGIQLQPLRGVDHATRGAGADHETEGRLQLGQAARFAHVAVVLLVAAVVLDQGLVVIAQGAGDRVRQRGEQGAAQARAGPLDVLDRMRAHQYRSRA
jgi:hypothetical protein